MAWDQFVWVGVAVFTAASFFFALAESALFSLDKWRAQRLTETTPDRGRRIEALLREPQDLLATIVLGNTLANAGLVGISFWLMLAAGWPWGWTIFGTTLLILLGCEVLPKTLAVRDPESWSLRIAPSMTVLKAVLRPIREVAQKLNRVVLGWSIPGSVKPQTMLTDEEYEELLELAYQQGALGHSEKEIILQVIQLDQRTVREVMKPRAQMISVPDDLPVEEMLAAARRYRLRRLPLYDESPDTIVGILNLRRLFLDPERDLDNAVEMPSFVPETMNLLQMFKRLQQQRRGLAVVLDEFGGTAGLITMEDILEEVVGELRSEGEPEEKDFERLGEGRWRVKGTMKIEDFREIHPALPEIPEVETMGGLLMQLLGVIPAQGESASMGGLLLTAQVVDDRRVKELLVEIAGRRKG